MLRDNVTHSVHLVVRGRVQGVGFRHFVVRTAETLGLAGWVRNRPDGAVEVEAEGARAGLERLVAAVSRGPAGAHVSGVDQEWSERIASRRGFRVTG